jgi:hypothetical protein
MQLLKKTEPTKAQIERGVGLLNSLKIVINVLYALLVFQVFLILPRPDDPELKYQYVESDLQREYHAGSGDRRWSDSDYYVLDPVQQAVR